MEAEKNLLIRILRNNKKDLESVWKKVSNIPRIQKNSGRSKEAREEGNALFLKGHDDDEICMKIFSHYSRSLSLAPLGSEEMALAYGNRSAFLFRLKKYQECVENVDHALAITTSNLLKAKLYCRKVESLKKLGSLDYRSSLEKAEALSENIDEKNKKSVMDLIEKAKTFPVQHEKSLRHPQNQNVHVLPKIDNILDQVAIKCNEKYGRHLVAKKDYEPGDIIFMEKLFVTVLNPKMNYTNCNYCLKVCWSGIPCDYCSWTMFCSEDCKKNAWESFHNVECSVIPFVKGSVSTLFDSVHVTLRTFLIGISEAGSIKKLKEELKLVDEYPDETLKGFYKNGKFSSNSIQSVYSLTGQVFNDSEHKISALTAGIVLVTLVQHSQLLSDYNLHAIEDFANNEDLLFIGSLLMKILAIKSINSHSLSQTQCHCKSKKLKDDEDHGQCCKRGSGLAPLASLINHNCFCNAATCFTEDRKIVIFAVQYIKKNSQIFNSYVGHYFNSSLNDRQSRLEKYHFKCDCAACAESWPPLLTFSQTKLKELNYGLKSGFENKLYSDCINIFAALDSKCFNYKKKDIKILRKAMMQSKQLKQPSLAICLMIQALHNVYSHIYGLESRLTII